MRFGPQWARKAITRIFAAMGAMPVNYPGNRAGIYGCCGPSGTFCEGCPWERDFVSWVSLGCQKMAILSPFEKPSPFSGLINGPETMIWLYLGLLGPNFISKGTFLACNSSLLVWVYPLEKPKCTTRPKRWPPAAPLAPFYAPPRVVHTELRDCSPVHGVT